MKRQRGASKFELAVVAGIFGVLATAFFDRMEQVQADAERTEVQLTIRNIKVGIQLAAGELIMRGEEERMVELSATNPIRFLEKQPSGYEGEATFPSHRGGWVFDPIRMEIAYRPRLPRAFGGRNELRWRYRSSSFAQERPTGLRLEEIK